MNVFQLAWRNLWRNGRRTVVTIGAMTFGLWVMILYSGIVTGLMATMADDILDYEMGDVQITSQEFLDDPSLYSLIEDPGPVIAELEAAGLKVSPNLLGGGLGASGESSAGVSLRGVDVARNASAMKLSQRMHDGEWLDPEKPGEVVLGRRLARALSAKPGSELIVLSQATDGSTANELYTVRGVLGPVADGTDRTAVFMTEDAFRELLVVPEGFHSLIVRRPIDLPEPEFEADVDAIAGDLVARSWRQIMPMVAQMVDSAKAAVYIVFGLVYVAIGILILNAMLMAVFERIREFGVLKAIGVSPGTVFSMILIESILQALIAIGLGVVLTIPFAWYLATTGLNVGALSGTSMMGMTMQPTWIGIYDAEAYLGPIGVLSFIVGFAILYPAWKAAFIDPLEAMRYQ